MKEFIVSLNSVDKVKRFVSVTAGFDTEIDVVSGRYVIDGKSFMGIFSMDLSKPLLVRVHENGEQAEQIMKMFQEFTLT
jgi:phosphocarrier protein HPr